MIASIQRDVQKEYASVLHSNFVHKHPEPSHSSPRFLTSLSFNKLKMPTNTAAWLIAEKARPLEVKSAPYTSPREDEIIVKNGAVAVNPVDLVLQEKAIFPLNYPSILGEDLAGEIVEVGSSVTRFTKGDRVLGLALPLPSPKAPWNDRESAFRAYAVINENLASKIPCSMSFEQACVLPLCLSTAASGMFQKDYLALQHPSLNPKPTGKTLLVWGGASSVGSNAIQLGVAAGYEVITTASPKNFSYVKKLGASQAFDYSSKSIVDELVAALKDKTTAGVLDCIGVNGAFEACADTLLKTNGGKFIAACMQPPENVPEGVSTKFIFGASLKDNEVGKVIYDDFLPRALAEGKFVPAPDPHVVGKGLEYVQEALDLLKKGASAKKFVVAL